MKLLSSTETSDVQASIESTSILSECCQQCCRCRLLIVDSGFSTTATFEAINRIGVELRVLPEHASESLQSHAICCVSFSHRATCLSFLGCLVEVLSLPTGERRLITPFPKQLTATNRRRSFRVPVVHNSGLQVRVRTEDNLTFNVNVIDVAQSGLEIAMTSSHDQVLTLGTILDVELQFRNTTVQRKAKVRRVAENRAGLWFENHSDKDNSLQEERMNGIVLSLQQDWLKSRLK